MRTTQKKWRAKDDKARLGERPGCGYVVLRCREQGWRRRLKESVRRRGKRREEAILRRILSDAEPEQARRRTCKLSRHQEGSRLSTTRHVHALYRGSHYCAPHGRAPINPSTTPSRAGRNSTGGQTKARPRARRARCGMGRADRRPWCSDALRDRQRLVHASPLLTNAPSLCDATR